MPDVFEEQAVLIAAEQAEAEGDAIAAEGHLRKLLFLQTARLGPDHQDVASTVHNLAVVCERAGRFAEAEYLFRRAYAVASAVLPPADPLVVRCQEDLSAFLGARKTTAPPAVTDPAAPSPASTATPASGARKPPSSGTSRTPAKPASKVRLPAPPPAEPRRVLTPGKIGGLAVGVLAALGFLWMVSGRSATRPAEPAPVAAAAPARRPAPAATRKPTPPVAPSTATQVAKPENETTAPATTAPAPEASAPAASEAPAAGSTDIGAVSVTDARLCGELSTSGGWTCTAPDQVIAGGRLAFLTRLSVPSTMQVEHRWYHGSELVRSVSLRVPPAGPVGYRTYSRQVIDAARTGEWRVELRAPDGTVLAEERFTVP